MLYHNNSIERALIDLFPEIGLDIKQFELYSNRGTSYSVRHLLHLLSSLSDYLFILSSILDIINPFFSFVSFKI